MDLQCHLATHNKPFKCSMCDESFLVEFLLDKHLQNAHSGAPSTISPCSATSSLERSTPGKNYFLVNIHLQHKCNLDGILNMLQHLGG